MTSEEEFEFDPDGPLDDWELEDYQLNDDIRYCKGARNVLGYHVFEIGEDIDQIGKRKKNKVQASLSDTFDNECAKIEHNSMLEVCAPKLIDIAKQSELEVASKFTRMDWKVRQNLAKKINPEVLQEFENFFNFRAEKGPVSKVHDLLCFRYFVANEEELGPIKLRRLPPEGSEVGMNDDGTVSLFIQNKEKIRLEPQSLISYLVDHHPLLAKRMRPQLDMLLDKMNKEDLDKGWEEALTNWRKERYVSKSMDRFSKISQLMFVTQDSDVSMFRLDDGEKPDYIISDQLENLHYIYPSAYYSPFLPNSAKGLILGSVVRGDHVGATMNDIVLLNKYYDLAANPENVIYIKIFMSKRLPLDIKGFVHTKGRPHNLVCVVCLDHDGECLRSVFEDMYDNVKSANLERNERFNKYVIPEILDSGYDSMPIKYCLQESGYQWHITEVSELRKSKQHKLRKKKEENVRQQRWRELCFTENYMPTTRFIDIDVPGLVGPIINLDLALGPVSLTFNSLYLYGQRRDKLVFNKLTGWNLV